MQKTSSIITRLFSSSWFTFFIFYGITLLLYFPSRHAGFVTDFVEYYYRANQDSFIDFMKHLEPGSLKYNFWFLTHLVMWVNMKLFPIGSSAYYILYSGLHALNAVLLVKFFKKISANYLPDLNFVIYGAVLLFLVMPIQSEPLVYRVCQHYFIAFFLQLIVMLNVLNFLTHRHWKYYWLAVVAFFISCFSLEYFFITPALIVVFFFYQSQFHFSKKNAIECLKLITPFAIVLLLFFVGYNVVNKAWVPHYGSKVHSQIFSEMGIGNWAKYPFKILGVQFWWHTFYVSLIEFIGRNWWLGFVVIGLVSVFIFLFRNKKSLIVFLILFYALTMLPAISFWYPYIMYFEIDRYLYFPSAYFYFLFFVVIYFSFKKIVPYIATVFIVAAAITTFNQNLIWQQAEKVTTHLATTMPPKTRQPILLLNTPDSYRGCYMFRMFNDVSAVMLYSKYLYHQPVTDSVYDVATYFYSPNDGEVTVEKKSSDTLNVFFNLKGGWLRKLTGYDNPPNPHFKVNFSASTGWMYQLIITDTAFHPLIYKFNTKDWELVR